MMAGGKRDHRHAGLRRGGHRRQRPGGPEGGGEAGSGEPGETGPLRHPPAPAGRHGGHPLLRGEGGAEGKDLHGGGPAGPGAPQGGAGPDYRRHQGDGGLAGERRGAAGWRGGVSKDHMSGIRKAENTLFDQ